MTQTEKKIKQVCKCEACGNEAEMVVTCTLRDSTHENDARNSEKTPASSRNKVKGTAICSHCGNEADMWVDL